MAQTLELLTPEELRSVAAYQARTVERHLAEAERRATNDSAKLAAADARACFARGDLGGAIRRSVHSLNHSVGVFHPEAQDALITARNLRAI